MDNGDVLAYSGEISGEFKNDANKVPIKDPFNVVQKSLQ